MLGLKALGRMVLGSANDRKIKSVRTTIEKINALEENVKTLDADGLKQATTQLKSRFQAGETLDALLPEAFALCREAALRAIGLRAFDVQLMGGIFLHQGNISEMRTGEGKTLVATFPAYLNALTGRGVHVVTVNDYLARRDCEWMSAVFEALGMSTGVIYPGIDDAARKEAYRADVTYGTNSEFGFDYLRDNMRTSLDEMNQLDHYFAIVDEVDSILIDEARTPLIISGPSQDRSDLYTTIDKVIPELSDEHFQIDEKTRNVTFTDEGNDFLEKTLQEHGLLPAEQSLYDPESTTIVHHVNQALRAHKLFTKDNQYIVRNGEVVLIDEFTGRMMAGRRLSDGLHQAIEAKEGVNIQPENVTLASVTYQNYFRLYEKLAGMTGTAATEAEEFQTIYGLGVVEVPTNRAVARLDEDDQIYRTTGEKFAAIAEEIKAAHAKGQPILVGTTSIDKSEFLSQLLKKEGIEHNVLNARQHEQEAQIIAEAGRIGAVTIATNMAGRGTDIQLGGNVEMKFHDEMAKDGDQDPAQLRAKIEAEVAKEKEQVLANGGLFVLATERHESRRIDNQLRGRSGRQGDPGRSSFFLSLEDDLMRIFGSERLDRVLKTLGMEEGEVIQHPWINKSLERAQAKVEGRNFDIRKQLLKFDDVMNDQRKVIFSQRLDILQAEDVSDITIDMREQVIDDLLAQYIPPNTYPDQWDGEGLRMAAREALGIDLPVEEWIAEEGVDDEVLSERMNTAADQLRQNKLEMFGEEGFSGLEKQFVLGAIDSKWREHLITLEHLRSVVGFRGYAQRDPLNEYKNEAFQLFEGLLDSLRSDVTTKLSLVRPLTDEERAAALSQMGLPNSAPSEEPETSDTPAPAERAKTSRNAPCPCGSGKKFKHCHGRY